MPLQFRNHKTMIFIQFRIPNNALYRQFRNSTISRFQSMPIDNPNLS